MLHGGTLTNRERDEREVKNYYQALGFLDTLIKIKSSFIAVKDVQTLHALVMEGKKAPTPYRDGQNVIKNSNSGSNDHASAHV